MRENIYTDDSENHIYEEIPPSGKFENCEYINPVYELSILPKKPSSKRNIYIILGVVGGLVVIASFATVLGILLVGREQAFGRPQETTTLLSTTSSNSPWGNWSLWSQCSVSCGEGTKVRSRTCGEDEPAMCIGDANERETCSMESCVESSTQLPTTSSNSPWNNWSLWTQCSVSCGEGTHMRSRTCDEDEPTMCIGDAIETQTCTVKSCEEASTPLPTTSSNSQWNNWSLWSQCSVSCGEGTRERSRTCGEHEPAMCIGDANERETCSMASCVESSTVLPTTNSNYHWNNWSLWSQCSVSCGEGTHMRSRTCNDDGDSVCIGDITETQTCTVTDCLEASTPLPTTSSNSPWGNWSLWSQCSVSCGEGTQMRSRTCDEDDLAMCIGDANETQTCTMTSCVDSGPTNPPLTNDASYWKVWNSWSPCDVSCGGGTQIRTRTCAVGIVGSLCSGPPSHTRICSTWTCPDCKTTCPSGAQMSDDCVSCVCLLTTVTGYVHTESNMPISEAVISNIDSPYKVLARTNAMGNFSYVGGCVHTDTITLSKEGFVNAEYSLDSNFIVAEMSRNERPMITQQPKSRAALVGETVVLCCEASGTPGITYYEWFQNGEYVNVSLTENTGVLNITEIKLSNDGQYICRANSPVGAITSETATITVKESEEQFCSDSFIAKKLRLPADCIQPDNTTWYNVGDCKTIPCHNGDIVIKSCLDDNSVCCGVNQSEVQTVQCPGYSLPVMVVKSCGCGACRGSTVLIQGEVVGAMTGLPVMYAEVLVNDTFITRTTSAGYFIMSVPQNTIKIVLTVRDTIFNSYTESTKVVNIRDQSQTVHVTVKLLRQNVDLHNIQSAVDNTISMRSDTSTDPIADIIFTANSFFNRDGSLYTGTVSVGVTVVDPHNISAVAAAPGDFSFIDDQGTEKLLRTYGMFSFTFSDASGDPLVANGNAEVAFDGGKLSSSDSVENMALWQLNDITGKWELTSKFYKPDANRRKKRQLENEIFANLWLPSLIFNFWFNLDYVVENMCFLKARAFENDRFKLLDQIDDVEINVYVLSLPQYLWYPSFFSTLSFDYTSATQGACVFIPCGYPGSATEGSVIALNRNGEKLYPADVFKENSGVTPETQKRLNITVQDNDQLEFSSKLHMGSDSSFTGPIYTIPAGFSGYDYQSQCLNRSMEDEHFRFFANTRLSIVPVDMTLLETPFEDFDLADFAWYPIVSQSGPELTYRSCFIKIKFNSTFNGQYILRAISLGGTHELVKDKTYGIREISVNNDVACIEYKCSEVLFSVADIDYTLLNISFIGGIECSFDSISSHLSDALPSGYTVQPNGFTATMPTYLVVDSTENFHGLYFRDDSDIQNAKSSAQSYCFKGDYARGSTEMNADFGIALTFTCT